MIKSIKQYLYQLGVNASLDEVTLNPLPASITSLGISETKRHWCKTAANYVLNLHLEEYANLKYVVGYQNASVLRDYAVISIGGEYFDPTGKCLSSEAGFVPVWELTPDQLMGYIDLMGVIPTLYDWARIGEKYLSPTVAVVEKKAPEQGLTIRV